MEDYISDLDTPLLKLSAEDNFTLRNALEGTHIWGGIGSGKSSSSGMAFSTALLRAGMGGIVLTAKPEEVSLWQRRAREQGRGSSVVLFDETQGFNFIDYELGRHGAAGIGNVIECAMRILEATDRVSGISEHTSDPFWPQALRQVLGYAMPVLYCAKGNVTIPDVIDFVSSAATRRQQYIDEDWCQTSLAARTMRACEDQPANPLPEAELRPLLEYWIHQFTAIPDKTRGNLLISLSAKLDRFRRGRLQEMFCGKTTIVPEMTFQGAVIILAMPALTWNEDGIIAQQLFKFMWQRAVESRNGLPQEQQRLLVFEWVDESQYFVSVKDDEFLSTCRASRACVVFLTQTLPSYYARLGKERQDAANGLVGKFATQIFHQNACPVTNKYASDLIGRAPQRRGSASTSSGASFSNGVNEGGNSSYGRNSGHGGSNGSGGQYGSSHNSGSSSTTGDSYGRNAGRSTSTNETEGWSEHMDNLIEPNFFASHLKSGGPLHGNLVTAVCFRAGAKFKANEGRNFLVGTFQQ